VINIEYAIGKTLQTYNIDKEKTRINKVRNAVKKAKPDSLIAQGLPGIRCYKYKTK